jgi:5-methylcytosine-specific restriction enzyme subunit McrC
MGVKNFLFYLFGGLGKNSHFKVTSEVITWDFLPENGTDGKMLPVMLTDISLISPPRKIIIDTKFYKEAFNTRFTQKKITSHHLYQLFSYLKHQETDAATTQSCEGILLYPAIGTNFTYRYTYENHKITVTSINLNQDWQHIRDDLFQIISLTNA